MACFKTILEQFLLCSHGFSKRERGFGKKKRKGGDESTGDVDEDAEEGTHKDEEETHPTQVKGRERKRKFAVRQHQSYRDLGKVGI